MDFLNLVRLWGSNDGKRWYLLKWEGFPAKQLWVRSWCLCLAWFYFSVLKQLSTSKKILSGSLQGWHGSWMASAEVSSGCHLWKPYLGYMPSAFIFFITLSTWKTSNASQVLMKNLSTNPTRNSCMLFSFHRLGSWGTERRGLLFWSDTWVWHILSYRLEGPSPQVYLCSALCWGPAVDEHF